MFILYVTFSYLCCSCGNFSCGLGESNAISKPFIPLAILRYANQPSGENLLRPGPADEA